MDQLRRLMKWIDLLGNKQNLPKTYRSFRRIHQSFKDLREDTL
jgi:hypothetical protein